MVAHASPDASRCLPGACQMPPDALQATVWVRSLGSYKDPVLPNTRIQNYLIRGSSFGSGGWRDPSSPAGPIFHSADWSHFAKTLLKDGLFVFDQDCGAMPPLPGLSSCTVHEWRPSKQGSGLGAGPFFTFEGSTLLGLLVGPQSIVHRE